MQALLGLVLLLVAGAAGATDILPPGFDAWSLYAQGNGQVLYDVLQAAKGLVASPGFKTAAASIVLGVIPVLAFNFGLQPAASVPRIAIYVTAVWGLMQLSISIKAPVAIYDRVTGYANVVRDVPAAIAVPIGIVSQVGNWATEGVEQFFSIPAGAKLSGGSTYNLAGQILADSQKLIVADPALKVSLSAYFGTCVVKAMRTGQLDWRTVRKAADFWGAIATADDGTYTKYYLPADAGINAPTGGVKDGDTPTSGISGWEIPCTEAYQRLTADLEIHAEYLMHGQLDAWMHTGVMPDIEASTGDVLAWLGAGGGTKNYVRQSAVLGTLTGVYSKAALRAGSSESLTGLAIEQAEATQKSQWVAGAAIFQHLMPYVWAVLQCFLIALAPLILLMAFVPGMGAKIGATFIKMLLWLALWDPLLAIVNFLVATFTQASVYGAFAASSGLTLENAPVIAEASNNFILASMLLGTSVPMIAWSVVSAGGFAFTTFIDHGIGSSLASAAGSTMATGNVSLDTVSMSNIAANKFDTSHRKTVGQEATTVHHSLGAVTHITDEGGFARHAHGQTYQAGKTLDRGLSREQTAAKSREISAQLVDTRQAQRQLSALEASVTAVDRGTTHTSSEADRRRAADEIRRANDEVHRYATGGRHEKSNSTSSVAEGSMSLKATSPDGRGIKGATTLLRGAAGAVGGAFGAGMTESASETEAGSTYQANEDAKGWSKSAGHSDATEHSTGHETTMTDSSTSGIHTAAQNTLSEIHALQQQLAVREAELVSEATKLNESAGERVYVPLPATPDLRERQHEVESRLGFEHTARVTEPEAAYAARHSDQAAGLVALSGTAVQRFASIQKNAGAEPPVPVAAQDVGRRATEFAAANRVSVPEKPSGETIGQTLR